MNTLVPSYNFKVLENTIGKFMHQNMNTYVEPCYVQHGRLNVLHGFWNSFTSLFHFPASNLEAQNIVKTQ